MSESGQMLVMGLLAFVVGLSGWLVPYEWNVLRLRRRYAARVPESVNRALPKVVGAVLAVLGAGLALHGAGLI